MKHILLFGGGRDSVDCPGLRIIMHAVIVIALSARLKRKNRRANPYPQSSRGPAGRARAAHRMDPLLVGAAAVGFAFGVWQRPPGETEEEDAFTLLAAAHGGRTSELTELIEGGLNVDACGAKGETALMIAACSGNTSAAALLIDLGAHVPARAAHRVAGTPLHAGSTAAHAAASNGHVSTLELLLARGADLHATDRLGDGLLHAAAARGHGDAVEVLLARGARVNAPNASGCTPLALAASHGDAAEGSPLSLLLEHRADVSAADSRGNSPLHLAVANGHVEAVRSLLDLGAKIHCQNNDGATPVELAAEPGVNAALREAARARDEAGAPEAGMAHAARSALEASTCCCCLVVGSARAPHCELSSQHRARARVTSGASVAGAASRAGIRRSARAQRDAH